MLYRWFLPIFLILLPLQSPAGQLYIFNVDGKYGLCDSKKRHIVAPAYVQIELQDSFFVAVNGDHIFDIFSASGRFLGTCNSVNTVSDTCVLALWYTDLKRPGEYSFSRREITGKSGVERPKGALFFASGKKDTLPGVVSWYDATSIISHVMLDTGGLKGVWQLFPRKEIIPIRYKKISHKSYWGHLLAWNDSTDYMLTDRQGVRYDVCAKIESAVDIFFNANWFTVDSVKPYRVVYNKRGERVNLFNRDLNPASFFDEGTKFLVYGKDSSLVIDSTGRTVDKVPSRNLAGYGNLYATKDGLYNISTRKYVLLTPDTSVRITNGLCPALSYCAIVKSEAVVYDAFGAEIIRIPRSALGYRDNSPYFRSLKGNHFYRNSPKEQWMLYNGSLTRKFPIRFTDIHHVYVGRTGMFMGKTKEGWGVFSMREVSGKDGRKTDSLLVVVPPVHDTLEEYFGTFKTSKKGVIQCYDADGVLLAGGKPFDMVTDQVQHGIRLAYEGHREKLDWYKTQLVYTRILLIDSMGKDLHSLSVHLEDKNGYPDFMLVRGRKVLYFDNGPVIWDAKTGKVNRPQISYRETQVVSNSSGPMAIICSEKGGDESKEGVYSLIDEKMVIPFGKFSQLRSAPYTSNSVAFNTNPYVNPRILAIMGEDGTVY